jgi:hypothetical protein
MAEEIKCSLCGKVYEGTDAEIKSHFDQQHLPLTEGLTKYVIALQKRIEKLERNSSLY